MSQCPFWIRLALSYALLLTFAVGQNPGSSQTIPNKNAPPADARKRKAPEAEQKPPADKKPEEKQASEMDKKDAVKDSTAGEAATTGPWHVSVEAVAGDQLSLDTLALYPRADDGSSPKTIPGTACATQDLPCKRLHLVVTDGVVKDQLKTLHKGDHIQVVYTSDGKKNTMKALSVDSVQTDARAAVLFGSMLICLLLYCLFSGFNPLKLIISEDNRYSNSRFQMALWFFVLITSYIAMLWLRTWTAGGDFIGGVDIPKNLLLLSGMSVLTFGGAKAITTAKINAAKQGTGPGSSSTTPTQPSEVPSNAAAVSDVLPKPTTAAIVPPADPSRLNSGAPPDRNISSSSGQVQTANSSTTGSGLQSGLSAAGTLASASAGDPKNSKKKGKEDFFRDLVCDDYGHFDFGDFQMLIVTLIAVGTYIVVIYSYMGIVEYSKVTTLPDVDTTLLAAFGLGQGAYLTKKAAGDVGKS